ncbi:MAG: M14 family metallocarboxypeptidase [Ruminococcus sp.]|nr:M14 family metallocarboxypeptidase [Ruminococcus sp.]
MIFINTYNAAPDYYLQSSAVDNLCEKFRFIRRFAIGKSLCGRKITALTIGNRKNPALYAAAFHGMEWLNTLFMLSFCEELALAYRNRSSADGVNVFTQLQKRGVTIIPCVNPDGVEIGLHGSESCPRYKKLIDSITSDTSSWQANARGVDLNHNFNAGWRELKKREMKSGITKPSATRYGGTRPFSEPETVALKNLCLKNRFSHVIAFHSQGREVYCTYGNTPERSVVLGETFAKLADYRVALPDKIAVGGGFKDWVIGYLRTPAITVETGLGKNPLPLGDYLPEYKRIRRALFKCLFV